jgi:nitrite reductase/ring-hydroxylating ferredoxin subunit/hemoglobin-like flavoprotein
MNETANQPTQPNVTKRGAPDAGKYFRYMAEFVGFTRDDEQAIIKTKPIVEKHLARIVSEFYEHLLRYPPTRKFFLDKNGNIDVPYLQLRMRHNANFWRRTIEGNYDDEYASYIDYVGRAHTSHGADPSIYIAERYVIGMVGFISHALSHAIMEELHDKDEEFEHAAKEAWDKLMMVVLEMLSRAYYNERAPETFEPIVAIDEAHIEQLAQQAVEQETGNRETASVQVVSVARADDIPEGERKIVNVDGISIGIFHHNGNWYALHNSCLHRGGPVCTGPLNGDVIECPWHGFQYDVRDGHLLTDPKSHLDTFRVSVEDEEVKLEMPQY